MKYVLITGLLFSALSSGAVTGDPGIESAFVDDVTVLGTGGDRNDPDLEVRGYTAFGLNPTSAVHATAGPGQVFIEDRLEVGQSLHLGGEIVFSDGTTQTTARTRFMLASGECDTNRVDILMAEPVKATAVRLFQSSVIPHTVRIFKNGAAVTGILFNATTADIPLAISLAPFDRLGILATNTAGTVLFAFEALTP
jgi:hypothetical protein